MDSGSAPLGALKELLEHAAIDEQRAAALADGHGMTVEPLSEGDPRVLGRRIEPAVPRALVERQIRGIRDAERADRLATSRRLPHFRPRAGCKRAGAGIANLGA